MIFFLHNFRHNAINFSTRDHYSACAIIVLVPHTSLAKFRSVIPPGWTHAKQRKKRKKCEHRSSAPNRIRVDNNYCHSLVTPTSKPRTVALFCTVSCSTVHISATTLARKKLGYPQNITHLLNNYCYSSNEADIYNYCSAVRLYCWIGAIFVAIVNVFLFSKSTNSALQARA